MKLGCPTSYPALTVRQLAIRYLSWILLFIHPMGAVISELRLPLTPVDMNSDQAQFVRETIAKNKVVIFSKSYCPYCTMAKEQFRKLNVHMTIIELDQRVDGTEIQAVLGELTGARTVPRCFIDGKFIGGGTDIKRLYEQGILQKYFD